jgi:tetratricopeptide (TPR) repeat protein
VLRTIRVEFRTFGEITAMVDDLTKQIKAAMDLTEQQIASDLDKNLGQITSPNAEALRYYLEAKRFHWKGEYRQAIPLLERAVALDPAFILAYEALGSAHYDLYELAENDAIIAKTLDLIKRFPDRVTDRDRYLIEGRHFYWDLSDQFWPDALERLGKILGIDPEDTQANYDLGCIYQDLELWDKALTHFEVCLKNKFEYFEAYARMAEAYLAKGMPDKGREAIEYYLMNIVDSAAGHIRLSDHFLRQGEMGAAREEAEQAVILDPMDWKNIDQAGSIALLEGDLDRAEKEYSRLVNGKETGAVYAGLIGLGNLYLLEGKFSRVGPLWTSLVEQLHRAGEKWVESYIHCGLASSYVRSGDWGKALEECQKAWAIALELDDLFLERRALFLKGLACLGSGRIPEAEKVAEEFKAVNARGMRKDVDIRVYDHLRGRIELERKNYDRAIPLLKKAVDSLPYGPLAADANYIDPLALAHFRAGDVAKAQAEYERIMALTTGRRSYGDIYAKSFYMLGRIFEQKGDAAKARSNYERFLDLWKGADPGLPEVDDARKRLAGLAGH